MPSHRVETVLLAAALFALAPRPAMHPAAQALRDDLRAKVEAEVIAAEKAFELANEQRDLDTARRLMSDYVITSNQWGATNNRDGFLDWLKTVASLPSITMQNAKVMYLADVAVISGRKVAARPQVTQGMLFTNVWIKRNAAWRLFMHTQFWTPGAQTPLGNPTPNRAPSLLENPSVEAAVRAAEDRYRQARLAHDPLALDSLIAPVGQETSHTGATRDKAAMVAYHRTAPLTELTTSEVTLHGTGDVVAVVGRQTELGPTTERLVFRRVWIETDGAWQLLAGVQFRDPAMNGRPMQITRPPPARQ